MNIFLSLGTFFTFMFLIYAIQSINYYIVKRTDNNIKTSLNPRMPFICALLASIFLNL